MWRMTAATVLLLALPVAGCGDDDSAAAPESVSEPLTLMANPDDPYIFTRTLDTQADSSLSGIDVVLSGVSFEAIERIEIRLLAQPESGGNISRTLVDQTQFDPAASEAELNLEFQGSLADLFEADLDGDNFPNAEDNCPQVVNATQGDGDGDGVGDACDNASEDPEAGADGERAGLPDFTVTWSVGIDDAAFPGTGVTMDTRFSGSGLSMRP